VNPGVLMVTGAYYPELSGAGLQCRALVRQLRDNVSFTVLTTTTDPGMPLVDEQDGIPVYRVFVDPNRPASKFIAAVRMTRILIKIRRRFSIMHLHGFSQKSVLLIILALLMAKRIAIKLTSVGVDDPVSMRARGRLAYWCYTRARLFVGISPRFQSIFEASGLSRHRFSLIPNGVDLERFRPASVEERRALRAELNLPADATVILFIGFFSHEKAPDLLFEAWMRLVRGGDSSSAIVFVGATSSPYYEVDASLAAGMREQALRLGLDARVRFIEATRSIEKYHRAADIFVLPSVREGLPNALLEAMACGTACIATRLHGVTDTLIDDGGSGILVPPREVAALEAALARLISDPQRAREMGMRARQRIERDFALTDTARRYLAAYVALAAS